MQRSMCGRKGLSVLGRLRPVDLGLLLIAELDAARLGRSEGMARALESETAPLHGRSSRPARDARPSPLQLATIPRCTLLFAGVEAWLTGGRGTFSSLPPCLLRTRRSHPPKPSSRSR